MGSLQKAETRSDSRGRWQSNNTKEQNQEVQGTNKTKLVMDIKSNKRVNVSDKGKLCGKCNIWCRKMSVKQKWKFICKWRKECEQMNYVPCLNVFKE